MRETQMLLAMGYVPRPRQEGLAAPPIHERPGVWVYDSELEGKVPVCKPGGEIVRDTRRAPNAIKL